MFTNVGAADRLVRIMIGAALLAWAIFYPDTPYSFIGWIGVVFVATGLVGWCALYRLFGYSTSPDASK